MRRAHVLQVGDDVLPGSSPVEEPPQGGRGLGAVSPYRLLLERTHRFGELVDGSVED